MIPYGRQQIVQQDIDAVVEVLNSDFITQGPQVPKFEQAIAEYCQADHAIAVNSATSALHIACLALDIGAKDLVWTSPISFVASANCALYCGARVDFVDINIDTANICIEQLARKLAAAKQQNKLPKALIVVHMAGLSCDMQAIAKLAQQYHFSIIEDASHAIGGKYQAQPIGGCIYSDITVFSFHPVKIITTAEGGLATTNDHELADKMRLLRSHGVNRDNKHHQQQPWYYEQTLLGFNYRLTELQAALGLSQLQRLDEFINKRHALANQYKLALANLPLTWQQDIPDSYSSYHLFIVQLTESAPINRDQLFRLLRAHDIGVNVHYIPIHSQPYYQAMGFNPGDYPAAEQYYQACLSLPMYPDLTPAQFQHIIATLTQLLS
jgi:UDP-4-amino-4,6-dideoxy-N-acetyl-beta-L-altrosamine transaminase